MHRIVTQGMETKRPLGVMSAAVLLPNALSRGGNFFCCSLFGRCFEDYGSLPYSIQQLTVIRSVVGNGSAMRMRKMNSTGYEGIGWIREGR